MNLIAIIALFLFFNGLAYCDPPPEQSAFGATGDYSGWFLNVPNKPYLVGNMDNLITISPVSANLYNIINQGQYLSASNGVGGYNSLGSTIESNLFTFTQKDDGTWLIVNPYMQTVFRHGYLCVSGTPYGAYAPSFCSTPYPFKLPSSGFYSEDTPTPPPPTPAPAIMKAIFEATSKLYLATPPNPYLAINQVQYSFDAVVGKSNTYTLRVGNSFLSAKPKDNGFNKEGPLPVYNQFELQLQSDGRYFIYSPYLFQTNGNGWMTTMLTKYGHYIAFSSIQKSWTLV